MGLETARRGMYAQQSALYTTGQNIANANTPGYTRQRVNFEQTDPYPSVGMNRPQIPGQMGTGVKAGSIQRVRESFLDVQYRGENSKMGYWETRSGALSKMEQVMNEPSDSGLSKTMDLFWQSLQDLAVNPKNTGARSVVRQRGVAVAETFHYLHTTLAAEKNNVKNEINVTEKQVNSLVNQIHQVNQQIGSVEPHGYLPNDLYDERDRLLDELSSLVNIKVEYATPEGNASPIAEGKAIVKLTTDSGTELGVLVSDSSYNEMKVNNINLDNPVSTISIGSTNLSFESFQSSGKMKSLIESYGFQDSSGNVKGLFSDMMTELDNLAFTFAKEFNDVHKSGLSPNEINNGTGNTGFFIDTKDNSDDLTTPSDRRNGFASRIGISQNIYNSLDNIANASASNPTLGDSGAVLAMADVINKNFDYGNKNEQSNFRNYYEAVIGQMAVNSQEAVRLTSNSEALRQAVDDRRASVSSVSLDEEMTNMIQFQHAYNASARMISLTDELLDTIINGMGVGGR